MSIGTTTNGGTPSPLNLHGQANSFLHGTWLCTLLTNHTHSKYQDRNGYELQTAKARQFSTLAKMLRVYQG